MTKLADTPMKSMFPPEKHNRIINAHIKNGAIDMSATDWMAAPQYEPILGEMYAVFVTGSYDEVKAVFDRLAVVVVDEELVDVVDDEVDELEVDNVEVDKLVDVVAVVMP